VDVIHISEVMRDNLHFTRSIIVNGAMFGSYIQRKLTNEMDRSISRGTILLWQNSMVLVIVQEDYTY
jgi:hypothetical protein